MGKHTGESTVVTGYVMRCQSPNEKEIRVLVWTYHKDKKVCIADFAKDLGLSWVYLQEKHGYKCVKAKITIEVL